MTQGTYQIKVRSHLDSHLSKWFDGWTLTHEKDGTTVLTGHAVDQAALHGVIIKIRNLNLPLLSVRYIDPDQETGHQG